MGKCSSGDKLVLLVGKVMGNTGIAVVELSW